MFTPVVPNGGPGGWAFLNRTLASQKKAFAADPAFKRDEVYFRDRIGAVSTAEELVADRRLLSTALTAFGLESDANNKAFLRKILEDGTLRADALGNRLADKRYLEFSRAFGFGDFPVPNTKRSDFADRILAAAQSRRFESAVGAQNGPMRLALNAQRELPQIAARGSSENAKWFSIMGSPPLRSLVQTALNIPLQFAGSDIDKQLELFKDRAEKLLGSADPTQFADPKRVEKLIRQYLVRSESQATSSTASPAFSLLAGGVPGGLLSRYV